jgi:NhaP-type Na+/H+ or K+/H+ antiporter
LNDGVSIVLFQTLVHFLDDSLVIDGAAISAAAVHFLVVAIGSLLIGVASGMMSTVYYWLFHGCQTPLVEVLMFMCWAMLPYYVCDGIEWSGIVAAVANGFVMDLYIRGQAGAEDPPLTDDSEEYAIRSNTDGPPSIRERSRRRIFSQQGHLSAEARQHIGFVTEILATALETAIFAYLGIFLFSHRYHWSFLHTAIAIFACCISRAIMIPSLSLVANWITRLQQSRAAACRYLGPGGGGGGKKSTPTAAYAQPSNGPPGVLIDKRMQVVLWFAGLRGAMSFALVEHVPLYDSVSGEGSPFKPELKAMTSASILFTVFVLGGYTFYVMEYLGLAPPSSGPHPRRGSHHNANYELASLISKADSGDEGFEPSGSTSAAGGGVIALSGRQLAFRRQRQQVPAAVPDVSSPNHNGD